MHACAKFRYQGVDDKRGEEERHRHDQSDGEYHREFHILLVLRLFVRIETEDHVEQFGIDDAETVVGLAEDVTLVLHVDRTVIEKHKRIVRILVRDQFVALTIDARIPDEQMEIAESMIRRCVDQRQVVGVVEGREAKRAVRFDATIPSQTISVSTAQG